MNTIGALVLMAFCLMMLVIIIRCYISGTKKIDKWYERECKRVDIMFGRD
jgi:hypothetical protein